MAKTKLQDGDVLTIPVAVGTVSGAPVLVGQIHGVALIDRLTSGDATVATRGVFDLSVKAVDDAGNSAVAKGDHIYYVDGDTPKLSKKISGNFFGYALETITSGSTDTINVLVIQGPGPGTADILAGAIGTAELTDSAVTAAKLAANAVTTAKITDANVTTAKLADDAVTKAKLAGAFLKSAVIAGGAAGDHTVTGIAAGDELVLVAQLDVNAGTVVDIVALTGEFTVTGADTINNVGGTNTTGDKLLVLYLDLT